MSEKKYIANNTKYYNDSNISEIAHVIRAMLKNKNAFEDLTKNNFGYTFDNEDLNLVKNYQLKLAEAKKQNPSAIQKKSNTFIDSVLVFDHQLMFDLLNSENGKYQVEQSIKDYMLDFKDQYGFEPIGFQFHLDEGTFFTEKQFNELEDEELKKRLVKTRNEDGEEGYLKQNMHAQAIFLNFNKETGKTCLRNMRKKDWSDCQDLLHKHFEKYGFDRGEPKQHQSKDHKNKDEYLKQLQVEIEKNEKLVEELEVIKNDYNDTLNNAYVSSLADEINDGIIENYDKLKDLVKTSLNKIFNTKIIKDLIPKLEKAYPTLFNYVKEKGSETLELLGIKTTDVFPESKQKLEIEETQPEPQPEAAIHQEPEPEPEEELTVLEVAQKSKDERIEKFKDLSVEEKQKELKKQDQRRKHGRGKGRKNS
ncbi:hypothetical protein ABLA51_21825 [Vibrio parahaemolyticus]